MTKITLLTVGSRGDMQPYIALGLGLKRAGYEVTIATLKDFEVFITSQGLGFAPLRAEFLSLLDTAEGKKAISGKNPLGAMKKVMPMLRQVLGDAWQAAQGSDAILYHPKALAGYHIAEKLGIPALLSIPSPLYSPTADFPSPALPVKDLGPLNKASHGLLVFAASAPYRGMVNEWRKETLGLGPAKNERELNGRPITRLYPISPSVLPPPKDWDAYSLMTGYWFLDAPEDWAPADALKKFLADGPAPVYVGFGSMTSENAARLTKIVVEALQRTHQRGILATGWGGMKNTGLPEGMFLLDSAPHDWLFPRVAAVVHHGGAGTTAAGLQAGKPTLVVPFFGDQPFWGRRVAELGVGPEPLPVKGLNAARLAEAIRRAVEDMEMRVKADLLGQAIRAEDGVRVAVQRIAIELALSGEASVQ